MKAALSREYRLKKPRILLPNLLKFPGGIWADVACGEGIFAEVLLEIADPSIKIFGLDIDQSALIRFKTELEGKNGLLLPLQADLENPFPFSSINGILLANGLHFFPDQKQVQILANCANALNHDGKIVIVEYNTIRSTAAVPYPIPENHISRLLMAAGFDGPHKIQRASSSYLGEMYAALAVKTPV